MNLYNFCILLKNGRKIMGILQAYDNTSVQTIMETAFDSLNVNPEEVKEFFKDKINDKILVTYLKAKGLVT